MAGCASQPATKPDAARVDGRQSSAPDEHSPLRDFNLGTDDIPAVLQRAASNTYGKPAPFDCASLGAEIIALDLVLGPDLDQFKSADTSGEFAASVLSGAITGLIPYHSVLRLISGARQRERRVAAAIAAGGVRRAYLKGLGEASGCAVPAAPARGSQEKATLQTNGPGA